ncbi:MAG: Ldh family oxidoreductase [SAR202 cluster bacterium]|jgi:LDH2 family malate/lactate/ureidoglycolate dehydrogenase|nr:Ldh family oxidoreductase [SAR202 cluster bacterium]HAL48226.1 malate dehydrogenase [Dehalococcoidia bacterium]MDP6665663.1 Ldh family oxidoreductase [SAR202 cluster bacterium]MDP6799941.1 Ldh family oxidoreductase [SAR202 cluster bacterium]MQG57134.1 Ldh family oxidoreductase [SAR202 cluster bacterium]|tara:strand:+ start:655 stop:1752 length:1098 start_codon:yes stop_codon:yes gene_type:complete
MLERFKVKPEDRVMIDHESLEATVAALFEKMGVPADQAAEGADVLTTTDLRAVETHGVSNMMRAYIQMYAGGRMNPNPNVRTVRETPGTAVLDADGGLGIIVGRGAMNIAVAKARNVGTGVVTMSNSGHLGAVGHFAMIAAQNDMIGVCMTAGGASVLPTFGAEGRLGANPISYAAPARNQPPVLFDVATSAVAMNKVGLARRVGSDLLPGWVADLEGNPIMEEVAPEEAGNFFGLPFGGTREGGSHKGYGFSMMVEIFSGLLSDSVPSMLDDTPFQSGFKHYFAAYDIAAFTDLDVFKDKMDRVLEMLKDTKPAPGQDRVLYPGLSEAEEEADRRANGIPLHSEVVEWFDDVCGEFSVSPLKRK